MGDYLRRLGVLGSAVALWCGMAREAGAMLLNPADFASLGALPGGVLTFNTSGPPTVNGTAGVVVDGIAVFTFDSVTSSFFSVQGTRPLALLSKSNITLAAGGSTSAA